MQPPRATDASQTRRPVASEEIEQTRCVALTRALGAGSAALRQRLWLVVAGDSGAAIEDPGVALGDGAVKCHEFRVDISDRPRLEHEMMVSILTAHQAPT